MRVVLAVAMATLVVGAAQAQVAWVGASAGTSFEYKTPAAPDRTWKHRNDPTPSLLVVLPLEEGVRFRLSAGDIPYELQLLTGRAKCTLRRYTLGIDYTFDGRSGETVILAGLGGYRLDADTGRVPSSMEATKLGYYVGVGEWYTLSRRWRLIGEVAMHRSENEGRPTIVTATAGLAFSF
ncbi:MAG TPA: hypothetical protein P5234_05025 [Thermoanaerobaculaceae bacterium]|nr:hypothetical protein [Thermoanaerobaculaceae bacterium]HRS15596.1 hypothetical protein [Thermoanaerobaculaceae bacterium]